MVRKRESLALFFYVKKSKPVLQFFKSRKPYELRRMKLRQVKGLSHKIQGYIGNAGHIVINIVFHQEECICSLLSG